MRSNLVLCAVAACALAACGGGGGGGGHGSSSGGNGNLVPVIAAQTFNGTEDNPVTGQVVATDTGDTLTYAATSNPAHGTLTSFTNTGSFTYTPNADFSGADTFQVRVTDSASQTASATMTVNLTNVNDPPVATNDVLTVTSTNALTILANDSDPDNDALTVTLTEAPFAGTATVNAGNTINLVLPPGFKGVDRFVYRVTDPAGLSAEATALVYVGISPIKIVTLGGSAGSGNTGLYVDDLLAKRLAHEPSITAASIDSLKLSIAQRAIAFQTTVANGRELRYVDLSNLGTSRLVQSVSGAESVGYNVMGNDGRFVVYEYHNGDPGQQQINVFDASATGGGVRLSNAVATEPLARLGSFNATGSAFYFIGITSTTLPWTTTIYRANLVTRATTAVSLASPTQTYAFIWPSADEARYIDIRFNNGGGMGAYVTTAANPASATLLHEPLNNPNVYFPAMTSPDGNYFLFTETTASFGIAALRVARPSNPGSSSAFGGPSFGFAIAEPRALRPDSQAALAWRFTNTGGAEVYEAPLATPQTLTPVFAVSSGSIFSTQYADDGSTVVVFTSDFGAQQQLGLVRRTSFGQSTPLTPAGQKVAYYDTDPSGQVIAYAVYSDPNDTTAPLQLYLVNVDAPQKVLPLGLAGRDNSTLRVIAR